MLDLFYCNYFITTVIFFKIRKERKETPWLLLLENWMHHGILKKMRKSYPLIKSVNEKLRHYKINWCIILEVKDANKYIREKGIRYIVKNVNEFWCELLIWGELKGWKGPPSSVLWSQLGEFRKLYGFQWIELWLSYIRLKCPTSFILF